MVESFTLHNTQVDINQIVINISIVVPTLTLLLLGHTHGLTLVTGGFGMLTAGTQSPVMTQTSVSPDLLQSLKVLTQLVVQHVSHDL